MSRTVRMDQTLSDEDRTYLRSTGAVGEAREKQLDQMFPPDPEALAAFNEAERMRYAAIHDRSGTVDQLALARMENDELRRKLAELEAAQAPAADGAPDYSAKEWTKEALEAEIDRINAEDADAGLVKGLKAEMVERLTAYWAD